MKRKKMSKMGKSILLSSLAIVAFGGVAAGTTYALFTSDAETQISVSTGKVSVTQAATIKEVYSPASINTDGSISGNSNAADTANNKFYCGGEVKLTDGNVNISKMVPGDKVTLTLAPTNDSNVKIKYRETYTIKGDDDALLNITGTENMVSHWTALEADGTIESYEVTIELPATVSKGLDNVTISLGIEAVQGNAAVYDTVVSSEEDLLSALKSDEENVSVKLTKDVTLTENLKLKGNTTIYGEGNTKLIASTKVTDSRVINIDSEERGETANNNSPVVLNLVGLDLVGKATGTSSKDRCISMWGNSDLTVNITDCSLSCGHYAFYVAGKNQKVNAVVRNSTLKGYSAFETFSSNTTAIFEDCTLIGQNDFDNESSNGYETIAVDNSASNVVLGFKNCKIEANQTTGNNQRLFGIYNSTASVTVENCEFSINGTKKTASELTIGTEYTNNILTVSNNFIIK